MIFLIEEKSFFAFIHSVHFSFSSICTSFIALSINQSINQSINKSINSHFVS